MRESAAVTFLPTVARPRQRHQCRTHQEIRMHPRLFRSSVALASLMFAAGMALPAHAVPANAAQRANVTSAVADVQVQRLPVWCRPVGRTWLLGLCLF
jgi:hypothetical protein